MKPYIITICLFTSLIFSASAQDHGPHIKQAISQYIKLILKQDYAASLQYVYPARIAYNGGRDSLIKKMQNENKQNAAQNITLKNILVGEPGRVVKYGTTLYSVVPDTIVFSINNAADMGVSSSSVAISNDDGKSWTFATTENLKWLTSVLPDVAKLTIPESTQLGILTTNDKPRAQETKNGTDLVYLGRRALVLLVITHNKEFLADSASISTIKEKWIKSMTLGAFQVNPSDTLKYGRNALNGVNKYIIDDKKYPEAYLQVSKTMKYIGPADSKE